MASYAGGSAAFIRLSGFQENGFHGSAVELKIQRRGGAACAAEPEAPVRTQAAKVCHSGSFCEFQCLPPAWKGSPPASAASGCISRRLACGSPGTTILCQASKFLRDCSPFQFVAPGDSSSNR